MNIFIWVMGVTVLLTAVLSLILWKRQQKYEQKRQQQIDRLPEGAKEPPEYMQQKSWRIMYAMFGIAMLIWFLTKIT